MSIATWPSATTRRTARGRSSPGWSTSSRRRRSWRWRSTDPNAIAVVRAINGATRPHEAAPGTIRGDFALETAQNIVHASDGPEAALTELDLWFVPTSCSTTSATSIAGSSPRESRRAPRAGRPAAAAVRCRARTGRRGTRGAAGVMLGGAAARGRTSTPLLSCDASVTLRRWTSRHELGLGASDGGSTSGSTSGNGAREASSRPARAALLVGRPPRPAGRSRRDRSLVPGRT